MGNIFGRGSLTTPLLSLPREEGPLLPPSDPRPRPSWPREQLPRPSFGNLITVLSIDGGGIRGLIPAVVLKRLEEKLQAIDGEDAQIADYFDVIAGTSTGALIAAMLVTPDDNKRPKNTPQEIKEFYTRHGAKIFPPKRWWWWGPLSLVRMWWGPKYDGKFLRHVISEATGNTTLAQTLSRLVVPTFDIHRLEPVVFTSFPQQGGNKPKLSDVCVGTSAAPTFFPAQYFEDFIINDSKKSIFHLIDGGVAANNPTMAAISRVTREQLIRNEDFNLDGVDYNKFLVLSIGTGSAVKERGEYTATDCAKWGATNWIYNRSNGSHPLIDIFSHASDFLVDFHVAMLLHNRAQLNSYLKDSDDDQQILHSNYLRIQAQALLFKEPMLEMDTATGPNMESLVKIGNLLLKQKVARVDLQMGRYQTDEFGRTNDKELELFAQRLVDERELRLKKVKEETENGSTYSPAPSNRPLAHRLSTGSMHE